MKDTNILIQNSKFKAVMDNYAISVSMKNDGKWEHYAFERLVEVGAPQPSIEQLKEMAIKKYPELA